MEDCHPHAYTCEELLQFLCRWVKNWLTIRKESERTSYKTPIPYSEELGLGHRCKVSSLLGSTWFQYSLADHSAHFPLGVGPGTMLVKVGSTAVAKRKGPFLPVTEGGRPPPSANDNSKAELGLQHDREAPFGQALSLNFSDFYVGIWNSKGQNDNSRIFHFHCLGLKYLSGNSQNLVKDTSFLMLNIHKSLIPRSVIRKQQKKWPNKKI